MNRAPCQLALLIPLALACFALSPAERENPLGWRDAQRLKMSSFNNAGGGS